MCLIKYHVLIFCIIIVDCYALNCRSDGGPKEAELKNIYKKCLKMQDGMQTNNSKGNHDQERRESRGNSQKHEWDRSQEGENTGTKDYASNNSDKTKQNGRNRINGRNGMSDNQDHRNRNNDRKHDGMEDRRRSGDNDRNSMINNERYGTDDYFNNRGDFPRSGDFGGGGDMSHYGYYSSTQSPRRYKREKRPENSGQRSQYNPNKQRISGFEDYRSDENNSSDNNSKEVDKKACAMHCFLENLEMTGDDGMPDRYLVTHTITKEVKNEDLKDFLQESIEECFQILDNENTEDKCDFSKNLLMCLSEKGRANCDDWKDDLKL